MKNILLPLMLLLGGAGVLTCSSYSQKQLERVANKAIEPTSDTIKLIDYSIHFVNLPFPYTSMSPNGEKKTYTKAWLILFQFDKKPPERALSTDFFIGNYYIPEYGDWKKGIYFRIYERALFEKLNGKEILIRGPFDQKPISTRKVFLIKKPLDNMELEEEDRVLGRG